MKNFKIQLLLLIAFVFFYGCQEFLEEDPKSLLITDNFYQNADQAEKSLVGVYGALQNNGAYGSLQYFLTTDLVRTTSLNTQGGIGTYTFSADNAQVIFPIWRDHFRGVNQANAVITRVPSTNMDIDRRNTILAEAKFLRALFYFNLVRYFGDVPFFETETQSYDNLEVSRNPVNFVYEKIIEDLEFGIPYLKTKAETQVGRVTIGAAKTLLSKVYLTRASMAKRDNNGDGLADFQMAANYAKQVIDSGEYQLVPYFPDVFSIENENNSEIIFDVQFKGNGLDEGGSIGVHMGIAGNIQLGGSLGTLHSTQYFHTIYEDTDIVRQEWTSAHVRLLSDGTLDINLPYWQRWAIGKFRRYPLRNPNNYVFRDFGMNWPIFRYGEVLLIYAEALNEINNGPNGEVFNALNQLRARARNVNGDGSRAYLHQDVLPRNLSTNPTILPDISSANYPDYNAMKEYIMLERARELGGEAKRWFDLVRWGTLSQKIQYLVTYTPPGRRGPEDQGYEITAANVKEHHKLLPIPTTELQSNPKMTQNPGY